MQALLIHTITNWHKSLLMRIVKICAKAALHFCILVQTLLFHGGTEWHKSMLLQV